MLPGTPRVTTATGRSQLTRGDTEPTGAGVWMPEGGREAVDAVGPRTVFWALLPG